MPSGLLSSAIANLVAIADLVGCVSEARNASENYECSARFGQTNQQTPIVRSPIS
ncbi:MAG: hypothetical protein KME23_21315 [Goleter apudmare HA4340-LM2]|nr:hypothetical protein [Goleter apudmare HA4340-LM2]